MSQNKFNSHDLNESLMKLSRLKEELLQLGMSTLQSNEGNIFKSDLVIIGAVKRVQSTTTGIISLIEQNNMGCARAILRLQLDTVLRLSAFSLVSDSQALANHFIKGESLRKFKCRKGNLLFDSYLINNLKMNYPWIENVYSNTSGYIHFSGSQIYDSVFTLNENTRAMKFLISDDDKKYPTQSWIEIADCAAHCLLILKEIIESYREQKQNFTFHPIAKT